jgi:hypothetical protein
MELGNELTPIVFWHAHECAAHNDELNLFKHELYREQLRKKKKGAPYQRYGPNSSVVPRVLVSARMDHTAHE